MDLLEMPITQLVQSDDRLCMALDAIVERLPSNLRQVLHCAADLSFYRKEVIAASARIAARQAEVGLSKEIAAESTALDQQKVALANDSARSALSSELQGMRNKRQRVADEIHQL